MRIQLPQCTRPRTVVRFPSRSGSMMSKLEALHVDEDLLRRFPLPLAQVCRRAQNAKNHLERHQAAYYCWEIALKLLAATAVVEYAELTDSDAQLADRLRNL